MRGKIKGEQKKKRKKKYIDIFFYSHLFISKETRVFGYLKVERT